MGKATAVVGLLCILLGAVVPTCGSSHSEELQRDPDTGGHVFEGTATGSGGSGVEDPASRLSANADTDVEPEEVVLPLEGWVEVGGELHEGQVEAMEARKRQEEFFRSLGEADSGRGSTTLFWVCALIGDLAAVGIFVFSASTVDKGWYLPLQAEAQLAPAARASRSPEAKARAEWRAAVSLCQCYFVVLRLVPEKIVDSIIGRSVHNLQRLALWSSAMLTVLLSTSLAWMLLPGGALHPWALFLTSSLVANWPLTTVALLGLLVWVTSGPVSTANAQKAAAFAVALTLVVGSRNNSILLAVPYFLLRALGLVKVVMVVGMVFLLGFCVHLGLNRRQARVIVNNQAFVAGTALLLTVLAWLSNMWWPVAFDPRLLTLVCHLLLWAVHLGSIVQFARVLMARWSSSRGSIKFVWSALGAGVAFALTEISLGRFFGGGLCTGLSWTLLPTAWGVLVLALYHVTNTLFVLVVGLFTVVICDLWCEWRQGAAALNARPRLWDKLPSRYTGAAKVYAEMVFAVFGGVLVLWPVHALVRFHGFPTNGLWAWFTFE